MEAGSVISGKYRLEAVLGRGGMGSVWRALHLGLNAPVAIKLMDPAVMKTSGMLARFHREAQAAAQLRSPHVVQIFDHGVDTDSGVPFIVMELLEGESLADRLTRVGVLTPRETSRIITEVCRALARAHDAGIVHRDLKPANLFLVANDDQEVTKVLDFGIAKQQLPEQGLDSMTNSGSILGTPLYMSPEQIKGGKLVDGRSDLWSLAVVACECLTGKRPFSADSIGALTLVICTEPVPQPSALGPVPAGFDAWFERAVMREPEQRFQTARELAEELRRVCGVSEDPLWSEAPQRARASQPSAEPRTPPQFGARTPVAGPDGLPLAPTVDAKSDRQTGDALAKSSVERLRPSTPAARRINTVLAALAIVGIAGSVIVLGRYLSASDRELRATPHSALPAPEERSRPAPAVTPEGPAPLEAPVALEPAPPPTVAVPSASAPVPRAPAKAAPRKPSVAPPAAPSASVAAPAAEPSAAPRTPEEALRDAIRSRR
jgi:eukaryotic-like serine/threonine-protein kinase